MRNMLLAGIATSAMAIAAVATAEESTVTVTGNVPVICNLTAPVGTVSVGSIVGEGGGGNANGGGQSSIGSTDCNVPYNIALDRSTVVLEYLGAENAACPDVPYGGAVVHRGETIGFESEFDFGPLQNNPDLQLNIFIQNPGSFQPCGGDYETSVTVTLTPDLGAI